MHLIQAAGFARRELRARSSLKEDELITYSTFKLHAPIDAAFPPGTRETSAR